MAEKKCNIAVLEITSWTGVSIGAVHYYGKIVCGDVREELQRTITEAGAAAMARQHERFGLDYKAGDETNCFDGSEDVRQEARKKWKLLCPNAKILLEGRSYVGDPQEAIDGPPKLVKAVNKFYNEGEAIGGYEGDEKRMDALFKRWQKWLTKNGLRDY